MVRSLAECKDSGLISGGIGRKGLAKVLGTNQRCVLNELSLNVLTTFKTWQCGQSIDAVAKQRVKLDSLLNIVLC